MTGYESYSVSGIPWMKSMPSHWGTRRAKYMYKKENRPVSDSDDVVTCFRDGTVTLRKNRRTTGFTESLKEIGYQGIRKGDLVIHVMDAFAGSIGVSDSDGKGTPVYSVCTAIGDYNNYYYAYALREMAKKGFIQSLYKGIRERSSDFRFDVFGNQTLPIPPRSEQDRIVRYLDWQVSKINKLIAAKKKEIALLEEQEQSIIVNVITKGLNPNVLRKKSGINWIEEIPTHWNVLFLSQVATEQLIKNIGMKENNLLSLSYGQVIEKDINTTDGLLPTSFEGYQIIYPGNIILRLTDLQNDHRSLRTGLSKFKGIITSAYTCLKTRNNVLPEFLRLQLHAADLCKVFYGMGGGVRQSLGYQDIRRMLIFVPEINEQASIVYKINELCSKIKPCCEEIKLEIEKLEELKNKLISDVVTGQIDVRGIDVPDFEYVEEESEDSSAADDEQTEELNDEE